MSQLLTDGEIDAALAELPHWHRAGQSLVRTIEAPTFPDAIALVDRVAVVAEEANHHPDIDIRWRKVTFALSTHSAGGITESDPALARRIDEEHGARVCSHPFVLPLTSSGCEDHDDVDGEDTDHVDGAEPGERSGTFDIPDRVLRRTQYPRNADQRDRGPARGDDAAPSDRAKGP